VVPDILKENMGVNIRTVESAYSNYKGNWHTQGVKRSVCIGCPDYRTLAARPEGPRPEGDVGLTIGLLGEVRLGDGQAVPRGGSAGGGGEI